MMTRSVYFALLLFCLSGVSSAFAQTAPQIGYLYPAGAQQGTQVEVTVGGKYMPGPCGVWIARQGVTSKSSTTEGRLTLSIDSKATLGSRAIRIHSVQGGSKPRNFLIGDLPEAMEDPLAEHQPIQMPVTFNGQLNPKGDVDQLRFSLTAGQQIVCAAAAEAIGSPSDLILRLRNTAGRVVASANDQHGRDPRLVYRCETPGEYTLEVYDFNLAGGPQHVYRLTVTDGPYLDTTFPPGVSQGVPTKVTLHGWNLPGDSVQLDVNATGTKHVIALPGAANRLTLPVGKTAESMESEPNDSIAQAKPINAPLVMNGRFLAPGDQDVFSLVAKKGDSIMLQVASAKLGYPSDVVMRLLNADGTLIREIDDVRPSKDPSYKFAIPKDGTYFVQLSERADRSGPRFIYRLQIGAGRPSLRLSVKASEFVVVPGESLTLPVSVGRIDGFADEIEITVEGLPAGVTCPAVRHTAKSKGPANLELTASADKGFVSGAFQIVARIVRDGKPAKSTTAPPVEDLWLAVGPKVPFELSLNSPILEANRLAAFPFPVNVRRDEGFTDPIRLIGVDRDRRGTVVPLTGMVEAEALSGKIPLIIQTAAGEGTTHRCRVMGIATVKDRSGKLHPVFHVAKGSMSMGCQPNLLTLTAEPRRVTRSLGKNFDITLTAMRRVAMESITISLKLPAGIQGITAKPVTLPPGQRQATISVEVAADAILPPELEIEFHAESSRAGLPVYAIAPMKLVAP